MENKLWFEVTFPNLLKILIFKDSTKIFKYVIRFDNSNNNINCDSSLSEDRSILL